MTPPSSVHQLTEADYATERLRAAGLAITRAEPSYVRHKPGETTIIAFRFILPGQDASWGYAHWCADRTRADAVHAKASTLRPRPSAMGPGLFRLDTNTVLYGAPNDARLRRLRWYTEPRKLKRSLAHLLPGSTLSARRSAVEVLRYKPERRIVAKIVLGTSDGTTEQLLLRYATRREAPRLARAALHLRSHGVATPAPIAQLEGGAVTIDEFVGGVQLRDVIEHPDRGSAMPDGAALAETLTRFHATSHPAGIGRRTPAAALANAREGVRGLAAWEPTLGPPASRLIERLSTTFPTDEGRALIHGDLHAKNVLVDGKSLVFVDLERVAVGSPAVDLGCLRAHAIARVIRDPTASAAVLDHAGTTVGRYQSLNGPIPPCVLGWHTAIGLLDQALLVTRHLEPNWRTTSVALLQAALRQAQPRRVEARCGG